MLTMTCVNDDTRPFCGLGDGLGGPDPGVGLLSAATTKGGITMRSSRLLAAMLMAGLALGPTAALAQTTVNFWQFFTGDTDVKAWRDTIAAFEAENPDIKINMELVPWSEQQQRFVTALA